MNSELLSLEAMREVYKLDNIVRYNTLNKLKLETVATHSFYTSYFAMVICDMWHLGDEIKLKAIQLALVHDIPEIIINDVTHDAKERMPEIVPILERYEHKFLECNYPNAYNIMVSRTRFDNVAKAVLNFADVVSVYQYCDNEVSMGNTFFEEMRKKSEQRMYDQMMKLEEVLDNATK